MPYISSENKCICDFCGRSLVKEIWSGPWAVKNEGWDLKFTSITYPVEKKVFKNWFSYAETTETKTGIELKCDVCIRKEKINKICSKLETR